MSSMDSLLFAVAAVAAILGCSGNAAWSKLPNAAECTIDRPSNGSMIQLTTELVPNEETRFFQGQCFLNIPVTASDVLKCYAVGKINDATVAKREFQEHFEGRGWMVVVDLVLVDFPSGLSKFSLAVHCGESDVRAQSTVFVVGHVPDVDDSECVPRVEPLEKLNLWFPSLRYLSLVTKSVVNRYSIGMGLKLEGCGAHLPLFQARYYLLQSQDDIKLGDLRFEIEPVAVATDALNHVTLQLPGLGWHMVLVELISTDGLDRIVATRVLNIHLQRTRERKMFCYLVFGASIIDVKHLQTAHSDVMQLVWQSPPNPDGLEGKGIVFYMPNATPLQGRKQLFAEVNSHFPNTEFEYLIFVNCDIELVENVNFGMNTGNAWRTFERYLVKWSPAIGLPSVYVDQKREPELQTVHDFNQEVVAYHWEVSPVLLPCTPNFNSKELDLGFSGVVQSLLSACFVNDRMVFNAVQVTNPRSDHHHNKGASHNAAAEWISSGLVDTHVCRPRLATEDLFGLFQDWHLDTIAWQIDMMAWYAESIVTLEALNLHGLDEHPDASCDHNSIVPIGFPAYVMNVPSQHGRRQSTERMLKAVGFRTIHFPDVIIKETMNLTHLFDSGEVARNWSTGHPGNQRLAFIAHALDYRNTVDLALASGHAWVGIFEDDIVLTTSAHIANNRIQTALQHLPSDADCLYLEWCFEMCHEGLFHGDYRTVWKAVQPFCAAGIVFSAQGLSKTSKLLRHLPQAIDNILADHALTGHLNSYLLRLPVFIQDQLWGSNVTPQKIATPGHAIYFKIPMCRESTRWTELLPTLNPGSTTDGNSNDDHDERLPVLPVLVIVYHGRGACMSLPENGVHSAAFPFLSSTDAVVYSLPAAHGVWKDVAIASGMSPALRSVGFNLCRAGAARQNVFEVNVPEGSPCMAEGGFCELRMLWISRAENAVVVGEYRPLAVAMIVPA